MPEMGCRGKELSTWAAQEDLRAVLESLAIGTDSARVAGAWRPRGPLCADHVYFLYRKLPKMNKLPGGIHDAGVVLSRWVLYFLNQGVDAGMQLPTERSPATLALRDFVKAGEAKYTATIAGISKRIGSARSRGASDALSQALSELKAAEVSAAVAFELPYSAKQLGSCASGAAGDGGGGGGGCGGGGEITANSSKADALSDASSSDTASITDEDAMSVSSDAQEHEQEPASPCSEPKLGESGRKELLYLRRVCAEQQRELLALRDECDGLRRRTAKWELALARTFACAREEGRQAALEAAQTAARAESRAEAEAEAEAHKLETEAALLEAAEAVQAAAAREEAASLEAAKLTALLEAAEQRARAGRGAGALERIGELEAKVASLKTRRTATQRKLGDANLDRRRWQEAERNLKELRTANMSVFADETPEQYAELEAAHEALKASSEAALAARDAEISALQAELKRLRAIAEPTKERFKKGNHFNAETELAVIQVLALGLARSKVPKLFGIFSRLFGVKLPGRNITVPGALVDGKRTRVTRFVFYVPGASHCKELAGVMYELNKLQVGQWLMNYMNSDETSCCYLSDGAEAQQLERYGQVLSRRINGKIEMMALDCNTLSGKTAKEAAAAYTDSIEAVVKLMEEAGLVDSRGAELLRRFLPTCGMSDRASTARKTICEVLGLEEGDYDPTCAEHALVNVLEEGRKAMDIILRELMNITDEQAAADAAKIKALRTCVGWFSSPVCALIYQVAKYVALCSSKGYAIGRKLQEWMEARLADVEGQLDELQGHVEDVLAICGSRSYVFFLDAAPTERLLSEGDVSMLAYLDEDEELAAAGGGKLRRSILTGARSPPCMAGVRAMALICEAVFWPLITAIKPKANVHALDVLPVVWPAAHAFFEAAAAAPERIVDGTLVLAIPGAPTRPAPATASQARRSERRRADMVRIRAKSAGDATVMRLLAAAFGAMAKGVANHAAEWMPAGLLATDGSTTKEGKLCAARITPELRARYDALPTTSTPVERLHAIGRCVDDRHKRQRLESRAGDQLAQANGQGAWLAGEIDEHGLEQAEAMLSAARKAAARKRRVTLKAQLVAAGRAKRAARDAALGGKRARKAARAAERARIAKLVLVTRYSELKKRAILGPDGLQDQLKAFKAAGRTGFTVSQPSRTAYCTILQKLLFDEHGTAANDLEDGDSGCDGDGVERKVRKRREADDEAEPSSGGKKRKAGRKMCHLNGYSWPAQKQFPIERILDRKVVLEKRGKGKNRKDVESTYYFILWEGFPPEVATWEPESSVHVDFVDAYEAALEAEAELDAEEAAEDEEDDTEDA